MIPRISPWLIPLLLPVMLWKRIEQSTFLLQLASGYAVQFLRVLNWAIAAALVYRWEGEVAFAAFSLARAIITVVNYTSIGVAPALTILYARIKAAPQPLSQEALSQAPAPQDGAILDYAPADMPTDPQPHIRLFRTALLLSFLPMLLFFGALSVGTAVFHAHPSSRFWSWFALFGVSFGLSACIRIIADTAGARLQAEGRIGIDNLMQVIAELLWLPLALLFYYAKATPYGTFPEAFATGLNSALLLATLCGAFTRWWIVRRKDGRFMAGFWDTGYAKLLLVTGGAMLVGQLADFLYGPANQLIIKRVLGEVQLAVYAPVLHIDGVLLLLVSGLSMILLPRTATAYHHQQWGELRAYYVVGTLASIALLAAGAVVVCLFDDWLFRKWFGDALPATQAILPLVLIHTVAGGSASIGRSVLFGMGKAKPYAIAAIIAGLANVGLAILLVTTTNLGLKGVIYATIITVTLRCLLWLPIYTMWSIRQVGGPIRIRWN